MRTGVFLLTLLALVAIVSAAAIPRWVSPIARYHHRRGTDVKQFEAPNNQTLCYNATVPMYCDVLYFEQNIDHFSFVNKNFTYQQKYLIYDGFYNQNGTSSNPPTIFFYSGNEGAIELFAQNSGLLWDLAPSFNALLVFAEHRYYGTSFPFGNSTIAFGSLENIQYLSVEQALADYAVLIPTLKQQYNAGTVITFGGSYGGMLSAWLRMKYPYVVDGAIAASAPILQFQPLADPRSFSRIATQDFFAANNECAETVYQSWSIFEYLATTEDGVKLLNDNFNNCGVPVLNSTADVQNILFPFLSETYSYLAMADYPYPANFLGPLPGNPINVACANITYNTTTSNATVVESVAQIARLFWLGDNSTCFNLYSAEPASLGDATAWDYQSCTEMILPIGQYHTSASEDFFYVSTWEETLAGMMVSCAAPFDPANGSFNVNLNPNWIPQLFGGKDISGFSRIVFSNGNLDPWSGGGVLQSASASLVALNVSGGAHHLDLRGSNAADPTELQWVREQEKAFINAWVNGYDDPSLMNATSDLATKWVVLISVGGTLFTVIVAFALFKWCRSTKKTETPGTYEAM